jgi:CRP-like cAMP-binding protein
VSFLLMRELTRRLRDADRKRIEFGAYDTTGRVAARLVELAERFGERTEEGLRISLPLSQDELAGWTGSSREAVTKALRTLREEGWIQTGRLHVVIHDLEALRDRAQ